MSRDDLLLEKVHLGQANDAERAYVLTDPALFERLSSLDADDHGFRSMFPADEQVAAIRRKIHVEETRAAWAKRKRLLTGAGVLAPLAAAAALLVFAPTWLEGQPAEPAPDVRAKGYPHLVVHRQRERGEELLAAGAVVVAGDVLQIEIQAAGARHGAVVSVDGSGAVPLHHPSSVGGDTALAGAALVLPHGYQLDDAPDFERFFLVTSDRPIDVRAVVDAATALGGGAMTAPLVLPAELQHTSFLLRKGS